jgi:hypothetical protein
MKRAACFVLAIALVVTSAAVWGQASSNPTSATAQVPRLIKFSGQATDASGVPITGSVKLTFSLYVSQQGGSPLWTETQTLPTDSYGNYAAFLGANTASGIPLDVFTSDEAQWLGIRVENQPELPRVLLVSVPYALKAHEAETLSGLTISDFVLRSPDNEQSVPAVSVPAGPIFPSPGLAIKTFGPVNFAGSTGGNIVNVTQNGSGSGLSATAVSHAGVVGTITGPTNTAVYGLASNTSSGSYAAGVTGQAYTSTGPGVAGYSSSSTGVGVLGSAPTTGVWGSATSTSAYANGVYGISASPNGTGVQGNATATSGYSNGVYGTSASSSGNGVQGNATATSGYSNGVYGTSASSSGAGVFGMATSPGGTGAAGYATATSGLTVGVFGQIASPIGYAVDGTATATTGNTSGVYGQNQSTTGDGVLGVEAATSGLNYGVYGITGSSSGVGVQAQNSGTQGFVALAGNPYLINSFVNQSGKFTVDNSGNGFFAGNLNVTGTLTKGSGSFKIDDPLDPANKYLSHSFVESPDMMNVYNGNITTDRHGSATVVLPDYFQALNRDFRYQLTVIGQFANAIVAKKIADNRFMIRTSKPGVEVSWQVTGIRQDAYADANRIQVEVQKTPQEQGRYLHPELFGAPAEQAIGYQALPAPPKPRIEAESAPEQSLKAQPATLR